MTFTDASLMSNNCFSFCLQSVWLQYYRETVCQTVSSSVLLSFTPERAGPQWEQARKQRSGSRVWITEESKL